MRLKVSGNLSQTDYLEDVTNNSVAELDGILIANGAMGLNTPSSVDDDSFGYGITVSGHFPLHHLRAAYASLGWSKPDDFARIIRDIYCSRPLDDTLSTSNTSSKPRICKYCFKTKG
ncbi:MAG: hypothetical protein AB8B57_10195 [Congregibacter sp.]